MELIYMNFHQNILNGTKGSSSWVNRNSFKPTPVKEIRHYKFDDDSDRQGEVVKK